MGLIPQIASGPDGSILHTITIPHFRNPTSQDRCYFICATLMPTTARPLCEYTSHSLPLLQCHGVLPVLQQFYDIGIKFRRDLFSFLSASPRITVLRSLRLSLTGGYRDHSLFTCLLFPLLFPPVWLRATSHQLQDTDTIAHGVSTR